MLVDKGIYKAGGLGSLMKVLLHARQQECVGQFTEALKTLDRDVALNRLDVQRIDLLQRLGETDLASAIALHHLCPSREEWCMWCVSGTADRNQEQTGETANDGIMRRNNVSDIGYNRTDVKTVEPLIIKSAPNVRVGSVAPLVITSVLPRSQGDNYVNYETVTVADSVARLRVRGIVLGPENLGCVMNPHLILWSEGIYRSKLESRYLVKGRFEVDLWAFLPDEITAVTPRITFNDDCFTAGQQIAICATELAIRDQSK